VSIAVTGAAVVVAAAGSSGIGQVIGPPIRSSSPRRGTRTWRRTRTAGRPSAPPVANQRRTSAYAVVRPTRNTRAASSTVSRSGAVSVVGLRIRVVIVSSQPSPDHVLHAYKPQPSWGFRPKKSRKTTDRSHARRPTLAGGPRHIRSHGSAHAPTDLADQRRRADIEIGQPGHAAPPHLDIDPPQAQMSPRKFRRADRSCDPGSAHGPYGLTPNDIT
jgi:hypothetical protein